MNSKTLSHSDVVSKDAVQIDYKRGTAPVVGGVRDIGGPNIDSVSVGVVVPNTQAALDELKMLAIPVNGVLVTTELSTPGGVSQNESITITGTVVAEAGQTEAVVTAFGRSFKFPHDTNAEQVTNTFLAYFEELRDSYTVFDLVQRQVGTNNVIDVSFLDTIPHEVDTTKSSGITFSRVITSDAVPGFGTWVYLGDEVKTIGGNPMTFHYYKRIA